MAPAHAPAARKEPQKSGRGATAAHGGGAALCDPCGPRVAAEERDEQEALARGLSEALMSMHEGQRRFGLSDYAGALRHFDSARLRLKAVESMSKGFDC